MSLNDREKAELLNLREELQNQIEELDYWDERQKRLTKESGYIDTSASTPFLNTFVQEMHTVNEKINSIESGIDYTRSSIRRLTAFRIGQRGY